MENNIVKKYYITKETMEVKSSSDYDEYISNIKDVLNSDRDQRDIAAFDDKDAAEKAFKQIMKDNPPEYPSTFRSQGGGQLAYVTVWDLEIRSFDMDDADDTFNPADAFDISVYDEYTNAPTEQQIIEQ